MHERSNSSHVCVFVAMFFWLVFYMFGDEAFTCEIGFDACKWFKP